jgi:hypothetical protein
VHGISFVFQSAQGFCLAGILVGAGMPASFAAVASVAAVAAMGYAPMAVIFTPSVELQ